MIIKEAGGEGAQAASEESCCSGHSLPQPGSPLSQPLAVPSRDVMLPCRSSGAWPPASPTGERGGGGQQRQAPPLQLRRRQTCRFPKPKCVRVTSGRRLPAPLTFRPPLPQPLGPPLPSPRSLVEQIPSPGPHEALRVFASSPCFYYSLPTLSGLAVVVTLICRHHDRGKRPMLVPAPIPGAPCSRGAPAPTCF